MNRIVIASVTILAVAAVAIFGLQANAEAGRTRVDCATDDLQAAIDGAAPGERLDLHGTCIGNFKIAHDLRLRGRDGATLRGGDIGTLLTISADAHVQITNVTITGGWADTYYSPSVERKAGGIDNAGTLTLNGSTSVTDNISWSGVGGIKNTGTLTLNDRSTVSFNGGGRGAYGGVQNDGVLILNDRSSITGNANGSRAGSVGGVANHGLMVMNDRSSVDDNFAQQFGGGIMNSGILTLNDRASIHHNNAFRGGGVYNGGVVELKERSSIRDNTARRNGAGIWNGEGGTVVGWATRVFDNTPDQCLEC